MCGIWYLTSKRQLCYNEVLKSAIQINNRGQNGWGTLIDYETFFRYKKSMPLKGEGDRVSIEPLSFPNHKEIRTWIYNNRYGTVGGDKFKNFPPQIFVGESNVTKGNICGNDMLFTFLNGEFKVDDQRKELENLGFAVRATTDTAVIGGYVQRFLLDGADLLNAVVMTLESISGAYGVIFFRNHEAVIARDVFGTRPLYLFISDLGNRICAASESQCFKPLDPFYLDNFMTDHPYSAGWRPFIPGEVIRIKDHEIVESYLMKKEDLKWDKSSLNTILRQNA